MNPSIPRPSAALVVAVVALFAALAGGAVALPGGGTVDRNDLKRGAVTKKALKKGAVTKKAIKKDAVRAKAIQAGAVDTDEARRRGSHRAEDRTRRGAAHRRARAGEPAFADGGEGDCVWQEIAGAVAGFVGFPSIRTSSASCSSSGVAIAADGPGGDGVCDLNDPGEAEDGIIFRLPDELPAERARDQSSASPASPR